MRKVVLFLLALGAGALTVVGQDKTDDNAELKRAIRKLDAALRERTREQRAPQDNFIVTRLYDVADLAFNHHSLRLEPANLMPSKYQPPEQGEEEEPSRPFDADIMMDLIRQTVEPETWDSVEGASIEVKNNSLFITNVARVHAGIARLLAQLREASAPRVVVDVVALPVTEKTAALLAQRPRELSETEAEALAGVVPLGTARVHCFNGQMSAQASGKRRSYLQDYDVEIASNSSIGDPITIQVFEGCQAEIRACLDEGAQGVVLHCRLERNEILEPMRRLDTEHGPVDLPAMRLTRVATTLWAPLGRTVVAGGATGGDNPCVFLLTTRLAK